MDIRVRSKMGRRLVKRHFRDQVSSSSSVRGMKKIQLGERYSRNDDKWDRDMKRKKREGNATPSNVAIDHGTPNSPA